MRKVLSYWLFKRIRPVVLFVVISLLLSNSSLLAVERYHPRNPCVRVLSYQIGNLMYDVDGTQKGPMDVAPEIKDARMFLVIRYVTSEIPGTTMMWDSYTRKVTIILPTETVLSLWIGKPKVTVKYADGTTDEVWIDDDNHDLAPYIRDPGYTMLPMRFVANHLGANSINWDGETSTVDLEFVDYECLDDSQTVRGRVETVTDQGDGSVKIVLVNELGEMQELYVRDDLKGDGVELTLPQHMGYAELIIHDDWIFGWTPIPDHQPFGVLKSVEFEQLDLNVGAKEYADSDWGRVRLRYLGYGNVLYFNCVMDGTWVIKNRAVMNHVEEGEEQLLNFVVDLGNESGTEVDNVVYSASLLGNVSDEPPELEITAEITDGRLCVLDGLEGEPVSFSTLSLTGEGDEDSPPKPPAQQGAGEAEKTSTHKNFPNQQCKPMECVPVAISNSLKFLNKKNKLKLTDEQTSIGKMKDASGWVSSSFGAPVQTWWSKKKAYMEKHKYPITTRRFEDFAKVITELEKGQDVEMCVWAVNRHTRKPYQGHAVSITGVAKSEEGYDIDFVHDDDQQDPKSGTEGTYGATYHTKYQCFTGGGTKVCNAEYYYFVVECPKTVVPEGSSTPTPATPSDGKTTGEKGAKVVTTPSPKSEGDKGRSGNTDKEDDKNIRLNQIKIFPLEKGQYSEDAILGEPVYVSGQSPMNSFTIPEGTLKAGEQYCWYVEAEMVDGYPCGVSHPTIFSVVDSELEWIDGELTDIFTDGTVLFEPFGELEDELNFTLNADITSVVSEQSIREYSGCAKLLLDPEGVVYDWFPLDFITGERDFWHTSLVRVSGIFESGEGTFFWGQTNDGIEQVYRLPDEMTYRISEDDVYLVSGSSGWWRHEIYVEKIKPATLSESQCEWINCEITSFEDGILYANIAGDEASYDFFALDQSAGGLSINGYTGCADICVLKDTVIDWRPKPDQSICGLATTLDFYQLDIKDDEGLQKNSNHCMVEFSSTGYRKSLYLNLSVGDKHVVKNLWLPVMEKGPVSFTFDLGTHSGDNIASILYGYSLTDTPVFFKPKVDMNADLGNRTVCMKPSWAYGTQPRNHPKFQRSAESFECLSVNKSYQLSDMSMSDYGSCESIPATLCMAMKSVVPEGYNPNLVSETLVKKSIGWSEKGGCRYYDGDLYDELSWWRSAQNFFVSGDHPFDLIELETIEQILFHASEGSPILLDVYRDGYHHLLGVSAVTHLEDGGMLCRVIHDINQDDRNAGVISEFIHLDNELSSITGGLWVNGSETFTLVGVKGRTVERPEVTLVNPTHASNVVNPYPFFDWMCDDVESETTYSLYIYKVKMNHPISASITGEDPVFLIHGLTEDSYKYQSNKPILDRNTLYVWYVTADNPNRTIRGVSRICTFKYAPAECINIRGQVLSAGRNPNTGLVEIRFKQCAVTKSFTVLSSENMFDSRRVSVLIGYSGCADVCVINTDDGLFLDSWTVVDGDCCLDEPCTSKRGLIIEAVPRSGEYTVAVKFKPCGESITELVAKKNLPDMGCDIPLVGYAGCAEVCSTENGVMSSWTALQGEEDCCDEPCCELNVTWRTNDGEPPVVLTCPGSSHLLRSILRLGNDCVYEEITFDYTLSSSWSGVMVSQMETIPPEGSILKTIEFIAPDELPAVLTIDVDVCDEHKSYTIELREMANCKRCCDFEVGWSDRIIDEYGDPPTFNVCEGQTIELEFVAENLCRNSISGTVYIFLISSGLDMIEESRAEFEFMGDQKSTTSLTLDINDENIRAEGWTLCFVSECGEKKWLVFTLSKRRDCFEEIFTVVTISEVDCSEKVAYAYDMERMKEWELQLSYDDCQRLEVSTCWSVMGEKMSDEIIRVIDIHPIDCP
jgi:hypothetical protein